MLCSFPWMRVYGFPGLLLYGLQVCGHVDIQSYCDTGLRVWASPTYRDTGIPVSPPGYTEMQVCGTLVYCVARLQLCGSDALQGCTFPGLLVYRYTGLPVYRSTDQAVRVY